MTQPDSYDGYHALFEPGEEFGNEFLRPRGADVGSYRPGAKAGAGALPAARDHLRRRSGDAAGAGPEDGREGAAGPFHRVWA